MKKILMLLVPFLLNASSLYLPTDSMLMKDVEKMAVLANMPTAKKPYSLTMIHRYNETIKSTHPLLYKKIDNTLASLTAPYALERLAATVAAGEGEKGVPNSRGKDVNSSYNLHTAIFLTPSDYLKLSLDVNLYEKNEDPKVATNNTYVSLGFDWCQLDAGYRDHWFGPAYNSALAFSTNAINSPSLTLSNTTPLSAWNINYEMMYTRLEESNGIRYENTWYTGNPKVFGFHGDISFTDWLTFGANRMFLYGGGPRREDVSGLIKAFFDPGGADNTNTNLTSDQEYGNQISTISVESKFQGPFPFKIYTEIGAEDTAGDKVNKWANLSVNNFYKILPGFGNGSTTVGIFFPFFLSDTVALTYEYTEMQNGWYIHHLYADGYRNDQNVMGHWVGDTKVFGDEVGSQVNTLVIDLDYDTTDISLKLNKYVHEYYTINDYDEGYDLTLAAVYGPFGFSLFSGHSALKKEFTNLSLTYYWK